MANFTNSTQWTCNTTLTKQSGTILTIATRNKFVDRDIKLTLGVQAGSASISATGNALINSVGFTYNSNNGNFNITGSGNITGTVSGSVSRPGWISAIDSSSTTGTASLEASVDIIQIATSMTGTAKVTPSISKHTNTNAKVGTVTTSKPSNGYYVAVSSAAKANTITATPSVSTAGYGTTEHFIGSNATLSVGANASAVTYIPITPGAISLSAPGTASINSLSYTYNSSNNKFNVTGSGNISGTITATVTEGYIATNETGNISGTASLTGVTVNKIGIAAALSGTTSTLKPTISRVSETNVSANVGSGTASSSKPSEGYYVAVKSDANTATITATPTVSSAGYGTTVDGQYTVTATDSKTIGAAESDIYYITVPSGSAVTPATIITKNPTISVNSAGLITASYSSSQSITPTVTAGYIEVGTAGTVSTTGSATQQLTTKGATTYNVSTSNQTIAAGTYLTGAQTFRAVTTLNIDAANIKSGVNIRVGDAGSATRIKNVTGTFTKSNTVSTGQTAANAHQILTGYSAWVDAAEVKGDIPLKSSTNIIVDANDNSITIPAGYYGEDSTLSMEAATVTPGFSDANLSTYFNAGTSSDNNVVITPNYTNTAGYVSAHDIAQSGTNSYYKIKTTTRTQGNGSVTLSAGNGSATFTVGTGDSENSNNTSLQVVNDNPPSAGVYYTITVKGKGTVTGYGSGSVSTGTGWITSGSTTSKNSAEASKESNEATLKRYILKSVAGAAVSNNLPSGISGRTAGTYEDIEIQPKGYVKIPAGYNPKDRYVFSNVADTSGEAQQASGFGLVVSSISGASDVSVGQLNNESYPIIANNVSVTGTFRANTAGWFSSGEATDSDTDNVTVGSMPAAVLGGSIVATATTTVAPGAVTIGAGDTISGKTKVAITPVTSTTASYTYYIPIKASVAANSTGTTSNISYSSGSSTVTRAGYAPASLTGSISVSGTATAKTSSANSSNYFLPLPTANGAWVVGTTTAAKATPGITNTNSIATITDLSNKTAGTDYWTLTPTIASSTAGTYKAKYKYNSDGQGWVPNSKQLEDGTAREITVTPQTGTAIYIPKATWTTTGGSTTITNAGYLPANTVVTNISTVTPTFTAAATTVNSSMSGSGVTLGTNNTSGVSVSSTGTAVRGNIMYAANVNGYISKSAGDIALAAGNTESQASATVRYITAITLPKNKTISVTTAADTALDTTSDLTITNNAYRRVNITNNANGTILIANSGNTTVTSGSKTAGNATIAAYDTSSSTSVTSKNIVTNGVWVTSTPTASGTYYGRVVLGAGEYSADSSASSNSTVTPKLNLHAKATSTYGFTTTAPGTGTDGTNYLHIDPDATATSWSVTPRAKITTEGYLGTGNKTGTAVSQTPTIVGGTSYYVPIVAPTLGGGGLSETTNTNVVSTTPVVTVSSSGTFKTTTGYGVTTTKPGGTDGTNYLTIDGSGSVTTTGKATSNYSVTRGKMTYTNSAGVIAAHNSTEYGSTANQAGSKIVDITPSITDSFAPLYIPITSVNISGGGLTPTNYVKNDLVLSLSSGSNTNMANITVGAQNTSTYPYYFKVNGSTPAVSGSTTVTRAAVTYTNDPGAISAHSGTSAIASGSSSPTVSVNATSASTYVSLKKATMTVSGTNTVTPSVSVGTDTNIIYASSDVSGVSFKATGGGTASANVIATTNQAGYAPANTQLGSNSNIAASSNTTNVTKYIQGVKLVAPSSGTRYFDITVPNGNTTDFITFRFTVDSSGNVTVAGPD